MGRSRRKYKKSKPKVRVGLPQKYLNVFKPALKVPAKLRPHIEGKKWDEKGTVLCNYKTMGIVSNPNLLNALSRTPHMIESASLQCPPPETTAPASEFEPIDDGSDLEEDDLKSALGKKRRDGKTAPMLPLTTLQRIHIGRLIEKYGSDYQRMFKDTKLNAMQHSIATLKNLCQRYHRKQGKKFIV